MAIPNIPFDAVALATGKLSQFFFGSLPLYFKENDTYKIKGEGILERYLKIFQTESEQYVTDLENLVTLQHPTTTQARFLDYIGEFFGSPPDTFGNTAHYTKLLNNIIRLNRNRGTQESLQNFFRVMGTTCNITSTLSTYYRYDDSAHYDGTGVHYDGYCYPCVAITLAVIDPTHIITQLDVATLTQDTRRIVQSILVYFLPINASLTSFAYNGTVKDISLDNGDITNIGGSSSTT